MSNPVLELPLKRLKRSNFYIISLNRCYSYLANAHPACMSIEMHYDL